MSTRGRVVPKTWTLHRVELERVLGDGHWHAREELWLAVRGLIDPRLAARAWIRSYNRSSRRGVHQRARFLPPEQTDPRPPASVAFGYREERFLEVGRRMVFNQEIQFLHDSKRIERAGPRTARCFRLLSPPAARHKVGKGCDLSDVVVDFARLERGGSLSGVGDGTLVQVAAR